LNSPITEEEIVRGVKNLKSNKASGYDDIVNEHIKSTINICLPIYCKLFNIVLNSGLIPESWSEGVIFPIYKNKGDTKDPSSYRLITLVSCLSKTFTYVLNDRLCELSDEVGLISESQTGFRKGYSTLDNIFSLHALISIYMSLGKKLYCTFVDFSKTFDTITRSSLWVKLQKSNITGKVFRIIHSLYDNVKSCIKNNDTFSSFFRCDIGVRQGENLYPFLFAIYLNDLEQFFVENNVNDLENI
jgi:hypothetical protein